MSVTKKSLAFLAIAFAISWGVMFCGVGVGWNTSPQAAFGVLLTIMFGPAIAAVICAYLFERGRVVEMLGLKNWKPNWWWLGGWALAVLFAAGSVLFTVLLSDNGLTDPATATIAQVEHMVGAEDAEKLRGVPMLGVLLVAQSLILGPFLNAPILTFSEELGWRGYLHALWRPFGFWRSSLGTGAIWGLWHAPAIYFYGLNYPENRLIGIALFIGFCTLMAPLVTLVRDRGRTVVAAGIMHGTVNAVAGLAALSVNTPDFPWNGVVGIGGFITLALMVAALWWLQRPRAIPQQSQPA